MKPLTRKILLACLIVVLAAGAVGALLLRQEEESPPAPFALPPAKIYSDVSDLAAETEINPEKRFASLTYGVHAFLWWSELTRAWDLESMRRMNFTHVRQSFAWGDIQPEPDRWEWWNADETVAETLYRERHILARIDGAPEWAIRDIENWGEVPFDLDAFATYCGTLAARYKGKIEAYQVWNEPNLEREWVGHVPSPAGYVKMLAACANAIREADPDAIIVSAGLSPTGTRDFTALPDQEFLWEMYAAGASDYFDVLGVHAPGWAMPPEASREETIAADYPDWAHFRHVERIRAIMVANGDADKQIAITEMGWTTDTRPDSIYSWMGVSEAEQADYLVRAYAYAAEHWRPWVGLIVTIYLGKEDWTPDLEQWWWALTIPAPAPDITIMRPAYNAVANMAKISDNPAFSEPVHDPAEGYYVEPLPPRR